jgi:hypothetical protein
MNHICGEQLQRCYYSSGNKIVSVCTESDLIVDDADWKGE